MAGDWIPMRLDLHEDPAVLIMAEKLGVRPEMIVGYCHRFWSFLSRQCHDGSVTGPSLTSLGSVTGLSGFPELLVEVGWLTHYPNGDGDSSLPVTIVPHWDRWMSQSAKSRILGTRRKQNSREHVTPASRSGHDSVTPMSRSQRDQNETRVEESRGEKDPYPPLTPPFEKGGNLEVSSDTQTTNTGRRTRRPPKPTIEDICRAAVAGGSADSSQEPTNDRV